MLDDVKNALSIDYSDDKINSMLELKINGAKRVLKNAGVKEDITNALYVNAVIIFVVDNWNLEAGKITQSPVFLAYVAQLRNEV